MKAHAVPLGDDSWHCYPNSCPDGYACYPENTHGRALIVYIYISRPCLISNKQRLLKRVNDTYFGPRGLKV